MKTDVSTPTPPEDFSLVLGGPLYQMYLRSRLVRPPADLMERRVIVFIVVTWFPLLVLTLAGGNALSGVTVPFLFDLDVHVRFLLALPLLIGGELLVHQRLRVTVSEFIDRGIIAPVDRPRFDEIIASVGAPFFGATCGVVPPDGGEGVIIAQAGRFGGWSLYMKGGRVHHVYNFGGLQRTVVSSPEALAPGRHTVRYEFVYDGGPPGSGGISRLTVDGGPAGEARVPRTMPFAYSADEGVDVGTDNETPVTEDYKQGSNRFTGRIHTVTVEVK